MTFPTLVTKRCRLREFREEDLPAFARYRSDPAVARYQGWDAPYTLAQARELYRAVNAEPYGTAGTWHQIALADRETDALLGDFAAHFVDASETEVGFTLARENQGRGYAREGLTALLAHLFGERKAVQVTALVDARNAPAAGLLEALGFARDARPREKTLFKGEWCEEFLYSRRA